MVIDFTMEKQKRMRLAVSSENQKEQSESGDRAYQAMQKWRAAILDSDVARLAANFRDLWQEYELKPRNFDFGRVGTSSPAALRTLLSRMRRPDCGVLPKRTSSWLRCVDELLRILSRRKTKDQAAVGGADRCRAREAVID